MAFPAGEVTFLFTDIEGSTDAWERHPEAMPSALREHQSRVREAVVEHGGVVVKDTGDGVFAAFPTASAAVGAAVEAQRALLATSWGETGPLRARMGLHTAEAEPEKGDYHGPPVNRCARIMAVAHGNQVVVSAATNHRAAPQPPPNVSFLDLGPHRLRDLSAVVGLHQVLHPDLPARFPPLRSLDALATNLPAELSSFVGRESELRELAELLDGTRLLTLTGAGGVGKTRLALQLAAEQADRFADGVWLVEMAGLGDPDLVPQQVASALEIAEQPGRTLVDSVVWHLRDREVLLVLDNCEHLVDAVATLVDTVLLRCPKVTVLTTSREAPNLPGEVAWRVPSLDLPGDDGTSGAEQLFLERAREVEPRYQPSASASKAIAQICRRLDGLPLAIELAAARVRVLAAEEIADRLDDRFRLLTGGTRTALPRQRTLEATVAWSYDLLEEPERQLFDRLSVFPGGFTLDAVEQVCVGEPVEAADVLELLTGLTDRSLVVREQVGPDSRYRLLETTRAYGRDRLVERGELPQLRDAHLSWVNDFARTAAVHLDGPDQERWLDAVATELDNVRAALAWSLDATDSSTGLAAAATLYRYWYIRAIREGRQWLDRLLAAAPEAPPSILAKALYSAGSLTQLQGDDDAACVRLERALELYRRVGNDRGAAWALHGLGMAEWGSRSPSEVKARFDAALETFRRLGDPVGIAFSLQFVTIWEAMYGDRNRAVEHSREHAALVQPSGMPHVVAHSAELSAISRWLASGRTEEASDALREALVLFRQVGSELCTAHCLESTAAWVLATGRPEVAALLLGATEGLREEAGTPVPAYEHLFYEDTRRGAETQLGDDRYRRAAAQGRLLDLDAAVEAALVAVDETAPSP